MWTKRAGKGTSSHYIASKMNGHIYRLSSISQSILESFNIPQTRENFSHISSLLRELLGKDIFAHAAVKFWKENPTTVIIFDGVRRKEVVDILKEEGKCIMIFIDTRAELRYERIVQRGEKHDETNLTYEQFLEQEKLKSEEHIDELRDMADVLIENNGTREELEISLDKLLSI